MNGKTYARGHKYRDHKRCAWILLAVEIFKIAFGFHPSVSSVARPPKDIEIGNCEDVLTYACVVTSSQPIKLRIGTLFTRNKQRRKKSYTSTTNTAFFNSSVPSSGLISPGIIHFVVECIK